MGVGCYSDTNELAVGCKRDEGRASHYKMIKTWYKLQTIPEMNQAILHVIIISIRIISSIIHNIVIINITNEYIYCIYKHWNVLISGIYLGITHKSYMADYLHTYSRLSCTIIFIYNVLCTTFLPFWKQHETTSAVQSVLEARCAARAAVTPLPEWRKRVPLSPASAVRRHQALQDITSIDFFHFLTVFCNLPNSCRQHFRVHSRGKFTRK